MSAIYNFSAGPATLPTEVLQQAKDEMLDWNGSGMCVMEMSHRGKEFVSIAEQAEADLRELMSISNDYAVLFLQGGASSQFAMVPLNLLNGKSSAAYTNTGQWSKKAIAEAKRYCDVNVVANSEAENFSTIPDESSWADFKDAAYLHYTPNETIGGLEFASIPETGGIPLVADMSSTILSKPIDISRFGIIYAGAQKNIGPAGITVVIAKKDLIGNACKETPAMLNYQTQLKGGSMYNTPPTYSWYIAGLVFQWLKNKAGCLEWLKSISAKQVNYMMQLTNPLFIITLLTSVTVH